MAAPTANGIPPPSNAAPKRQQPNTFSTKRQRFTSGMRMEAWKFSLYLLIPIAASAYFNSPETQKYWADYFQYMQYPPVKESFQEVVEDFRRRRIQQEQQRKAYAEQMSSLQDAAERSRQFQLQLQQEAGGKAGATTDSSSSNSNQSAWRWLSWGSKKTNEPIGK